MAEVLPHRFELRPVASMTPHPRNARRGNVDDLEESIDALGFYGALVVQATTGHVLVGNHRREAAMRQGIEALPCVVVDVDDDVAERILIGDNRYADLATWDEAALTAQLQRLALDGGLAGTGFSEADLLRRVEQPDTTPQLGGLTFMVLVEAEDEAHQVELLDELLSQGLRARPIMG